MEFSLGSYWNYGSKYCGLEYSSTQEGQIQIFGITANKKKGEFNLEKTFKTSNPEECTKHLPKNQHCFLCITSNQVLLKSTATSGPPAKVVSSAFPNIDLGEFYFEILQTSTGNAVALCRKAQVDQIVKSFEQTGVYITGFSFGFFSVQNLLQVIGREAFAVSSYQIISSQKQIESFSKLEGNQEEVQYSIGDTEISSKYLLALSAIFNYTRVNTHTTSNIELKNSELKKEHQQKIFFRKGLTAGSGLLFFLLLINFLVFSGYYSSLQQLTGKYHVEASQREAFNEKKLMIREKEKMVANILNNSNSRSSFYVNRLTGSKPTSILLKEFIFQPIKNQVKENEPIELVESTILLAGESADEREFSLWIKNLENITWIGEVKISDFSYSSAGTSEFKITIKIKEDEAVN